MSKWPSFVPSVDQAMASQKRHCSLPKNHLGRHRCDAEFNDGACNTWASDGHYRDRVACPSCGFVAIRKVWLHKDGEVTVPYCSICELERSALRHEHQSISMRIRASKMRAKRDAKK